MSKILHTVNDKVLCEMPPVQPKAVSAGLNLGGVSQQQLVRLRALADHNTATFSVLEGSHVGVRKSSLPRILATGVVQGQEFGLTEGILVPCAEIVLVEWAIPKPPEAPPPTRAPGPGIVVVDVG